MTGSTRLSVAPGERRSRVHHVTGHLTVRTMGQDADGAKVGLIATRALLLSGDDVRIEVDVAPGAWLDVVEATGTVAYEGAAPSSWTVDANVGDGAVLTWAGMPFVVSDEIASHRGTHLRLHGTGKVLMQEKIVLGAPVRRAGICPRPWTPATTPGHCRWNTWTWDGRPVRCQASSEAFVPWTRSRPWGGRPRHSASRTREAPGPERPTFA